MIWELYPEVSVFKESPLIYVWGQTVNRRSEVIPIFTVEYDFVGSAIRYGKTMTSPFMPSWS